jgi:hypothetical protein
MRAYRRYRCDEGHEWTVATQTGAPEIEANTICPHGHVAVTCNEELPADEVQILIRPAARVVDSVAGRIWDADRYFVVLLDRRDHELCMSKSHYPWDEAVKLALLFKGKTEDRALEWWKRKAL